MSSFSVTIEAAKVLGVSPDASLQEIRDAYRAKSKRYHPDAGGEEWAFRIVAQAYELLSVARVVRASEEPARPARPSYTPPPRSQSAAGSSRGHASSHQTRPGPDPTAQGTPPPRPHVDPKAARETVRPGVQETAAKPETLVDVERLSIRYQPEHVWLISDHGNENRLLSCSLNLTWPAPDFPTAPADIPDHDALLRKLEGAFGHVAAKTRAGSARSAVVDGRFSGWLSYSGQEEAAAAFELLHEQVHAAGLAVKQWSRDLVIPRQWR